MKRVLFLGVVLTRAAFAQTDDGAVARLPWELPTDAERACTFLPQPEPAQLTPSAVRSLLAGRQPVPLPVDVPEAYAASTLLPDGKYCLAVWTSPVVSGQECRFTFDWRGTFSSRLIEHGESRMPDLAGSRARVVLDRQPVFIECNRDPAQWVTSALFWATLPYELGARVVLNKGAIIVGVTNYLDRPLTGTIRIVSGRGVRMLVSTISFAAPPGGIALRYLPVREATEDEPVIEVIVVLTGALDGHVRRVTVQCRSGALFRNPELGKIIGVLPEFVPLRFDMQEDGRLACKIAGTPLLRNVEFDFGTGERCGNAMTGSARCAAGVVLACGTNIAQISRLIRMNGRGNCEVFFGYSMLETGPTGTPPRLECDLAWSVAQDALVAAKSNGAFRFGLLDPVHRARTLKELSGPDVDEWALVLGNDWLIFNLDCAVLTVTQPTPEADLHLELRSRTAWPTPAPSGRSGTIQCFVHLPLAKR